MTTKPIKTIEHLRQVIESRSIPEALTGCWLWWGAKTIGYGDVRTQVFKTRKAHRLSYFAFRGLVSDELTIDHLCKNKSCVNPDHLEPVTTEENTKRYARGIVRCCRGHEFTGTSRGQRICRQCNAERMRQHRAKKRQP
jgi:hypothetical protein